MKLIVYFTLCIVSGSPLLIFNELNSHFPALFNPTSPVELIKNALDSTVSTPTAITTAEATPTIAVEDPLNEETVAIPYDSGYADNSEPVREQDTIIADIPQDTTTENNDQVNAQDRVNVEDQALNYSNQYYDSNYNTNHGYAS